jgi:hypothetical protein
MDRFHRMVSSRTVKRIRRVPDDNGKADNPQRTASNRTDKRIRSVLSDNVPAAAEIPAMTCLQGKRNNDSE